MAVLKIKKGMLFMCIKRVEMNGDPNHVAYWEGRVYRSELDDYITDDGGDKYHCWSSKASEYFVNVDDIYTLEKLPRKYGKIILKCKEYGLVLSVHRNESGFCWIINDVNNNDFYTSSSYPPFNNEDDAWHSAIRRASEVIYKSEYKKVMT